MARRSLVAALTGRTPGPWIVVLIVVLAVAAVMKKLRPAHGAAWVLAACFAVGIGAQLNLGARLQSDGFYYFAYLRSLAFDRDVDFTNDYRLLGLGDKTYLFQPTATGHAHSAWTIGPAIVWSPFFAAGHGVARYLAARGVDVHTDGTSYPYRQAICIGSLFYGLLGCWFCYRLTRRFAPHSHAVAAVALTVAGSFMLWYLVKEPSMTHASSMAAVAGFAWMWAATREGRTLAQWAALGAIAGLTALIRWQNALFAVLPAIDAALAVYSSWRRGDRASARLATVGGLVFLVAALLAFLPQMLAWKAIYGSYIARSPVGPQIFWAHPRIADILWSARNGLLSTSPLLYLGAVGLILFAVARPAAGLPMIAAVALMVYFNSCIQDWWGSAGFGGRRFDGTIPFFCVGLATFFEAAAATVRRHAAGAVIAAGTLLAVWNLGLLSAANAGSVRIGETVSFDRAWAAQAHEVHGWIGNPFTYPASLWFALQNGVTPGDYDLLSTNRFLSEPLQPYGRVDVGGDDEWLVLEGWHAPEREGAITYRWTSTPASVRIPLDHAAPLTVQVRLHAFAYPASPPQSLVVSANGHSCPSMRVAAGWETVECALDESAWHRGVNVLTLAFSYAHRPADVGLGGDDRMLAAAVDWVRVAVTR